MQSTRPVLSDLSFYDQVINSHTPALLIQNYSYDYNERKCNQVYLRLKDLLIDAHIDEVHKALEELLKAASSMDEDFVLAAFKHILGHKHCAEALFVKKDQNGKNLFDRYMACDFGVPEHHQGLINRIKVKRLLKLAKSIDEMKHYGESIKSKATVKGNAIVETANLLRQQISTLDTGTKKYVFDVDLDANKRFTSILNQNDKLFGEHRGWRRVALNVAACIAGLGIFYALTCVKNYRKTNHKHFFLFNETETQKKVKQVDKAVRKVQSKHIL